MTAGQGRPTAAELVRAVREAMRAELLPELTGPAAYRARLAISALGMVERELSADPAPGPDAATALGYPDDRALAAVIRAGALDDRVDAVRAALAVDVAARLAVTAPDYAEGYEPDRF